VRNVHQWQSATDTYRRDIQDCINAASAAGEEDLATVLRNISSMPEVIEKQRIAAARLVRLSDDPVKSAKAEVNYKEPGGLAAARRPVLVSDHWRGGYGFLKSR
jgi:hypothetical protein